MLSILKKTGSRKIKKEIPEVSAFWSPRQSGKSLLSRMFALTLAKEYSNTKICLIDFDIITPSQPYKGIDLNQVAQMVFKGEFNADYIIKNLSALNKNVYCLGGLTEILKMDLLDMDICNRLIDSAEKNYDFVVIDTGREINFSATLTALDKAGAIIVPVNNKEGCIRHTKRYLDFMRDNLQIDYNKIMIVKNLIDQQALSEKEVEQLLEYSVICSCEQISSESEKLNSLISALTAPEQHRKAN